MLCESSRMTAGVPPSRLAGARQSELAGMRVLIGVFMWVAAGLALARGATAAETITFGTDWKAEAEHGGEYPAGAAGVYRAGGLGGTIRQGGAGAPPARRGAPGRDSVDARQQPLLSPKFVQ